MLEPLCWLGREQPVLLAALADPDDASAKGLAGTILRECGETWLAIQTALALGQTRLGFMTEHATAGRSPASVELDLPAMLAGMVVKLDSVLTEVVGALPIRDGHYASERRTAGATGIPPTRPPSSP